MGSPYVLAIDQGTTSTRAIVYDHQGSCLGKASREFPQYFPKSGWVEHDADEIWSTVETVVPEALAVAGIKSGEIAAIGVTNQRETSLLWERTNSRAMGRALVWQDRRTADFCRQHHADEAWIQEKTGLVLDPYFSATKWQWILNSASEIRRQAESGMLAAGTIDSFLIWRLTGGKVHATDVTNASRTMLLNLETAVWDDDLCRYFEVPREILPEVRPSAAHFGATSGLSFLPDGIAIAGVAGDQQAALFGQCAFEAGEAKCTYGTGAFFLLHTGCQPIRSKHRMLTTLAASPDGRRYYALEGSVFVAGAAVQWLRDGLEMIGKASDIEALAEQSDSEQTILFVPGLVGLGSPHWIPEARGVLFGLTRATTRRELARATLQGVASQVADLVECAVQDGGTPLQSLRVDGGMTGNAWFLQCQADILGMQVLQVPDAESTAMGAAFLAGLQVKVWPDLASLRRLLPETRRFNPAWTAPRRQKYLKQWHKAVEAVIAFYTEIP